MQANAPHCRLQGQLHPLAPEAVPFRTQRAVMAGGRCELPLAARRPLGRGAYDPGTLLLSRSGSGHPIPFDQRPARFHSLYRCPIAISELLSK